MSDVFARQQLGCIVHYLHELSGFNPESLGWSVFSNIIKQRMAACLIDDIGSYSQLLQRSDIERHALIEATVIPETWFFRDPSAFGALKQIAINWHSNAPLRILSLPCASGEEPYSIAITLREAGLQPNQFRIDAADISAIAITKAIQAVYTDNAFRGATTDSGAHYFIKTTQGYKLQGVICTDVSFTVRNIFALNEISSPYDIVFCRNLLIYFDKETRKRAFSQLHTLLVADGLLFLGAAEAMQAAAHGWVTTAYANIFRKSSSYNL
jgi:chemotaxis protein methyltransferase WspC